MKFDSIKSKAKSIFIRQMNDWDKHCTFGLLPDGKSPAFDALLHFVLASKGDRDEMREFADLFVKQEGNSDPLLQMATSTTASGLKRNWHQVLLRAREAGLSIIDKWDVREVVALINLFPDAVPASYKGKELMLYIKDNENSDWMVEAVDKKRIDRPRGG